MLAQAAVTRLLDDAGGIRPMAELERDAIAFALARSASYSEAARVLGIGRSTLYRRLAEYAQAPLPGAAPSA